MVIKQAIEINAPAEKVFDYLKDFNNRTEFINYMDEVRLVSVKSEGLGVRYSEIATIFGRKFETVYEVIAFEEGSLIKVKSVDAVFPITSSIRLKPSERGTFLGLEIEIKLPFLMKVGEPVIRGFIDSEAFRILKTIKNKVESSGQPVN